MTLQSPGPKRIQSLSTENACKSPMRLAEASARRSVVLKDSSFKPRMLKAQKVAEKELLIPPLGPKAELTVASEDVAFSLP